MKLGIVTGTVVASQKLPEFEGEKFLIVQPLDENRKPAGSEIIANDIAQAGEGDLVIFETGREAALAISGKETVNVSDAVIMGVVDSTSLT
ncbi:MAG: EutN/CcmL family microcompartment protein [Leptospiraceae bacterium]|nr:EutN/CcmL family microcompartment protein [Leptospiraceae bacterium]MCB1199331.1 EutN/CcmL family microcompartment protein [Leptospiraceae bacterium]